MRFMRSLTLLIFRYLCRYVERYVVWPFVSPKIYFFLYCSNVQIFQLSLFYLIIMFGTVDELFLVFPALSNRYSVHTIRSGGDGATMMWLAHVVVAVTLLYLLVYLAAVLHISDLYYMLIYWWIVAIYLLPKMSSHSYIYMYLYVLSPYLYLCIM